MALIFAQLASVRGLRGIAAAWNVNAHHHYHLGGQPLARSTLADANRRRPPDGWPLNVAIHLPRFSIAIHAQKNKLTV